ncbi:ribulose-phosphate 3-epimerase, partial [Salmonella enterica subsp. enterica serovar Weltevreden]|nr:ribulose-phosphate 3-epimerase [Salmonella enterica subsp. enterica serovar Weltevreden]
TAKGLGAGAVVVHFDVMDYLFVAYVSIGPLVLISLRLFGITAPFDVQLMVKRVVRIVTDFAAGGGCFITFLAECCVLVEG